jgi:hypothetical protein
MKRHKIDESENVPSFDKYFLKPVYIPNFIFDDGELRTFDGFCRADGPTRGDEQNWERAIGVFTAEGKYFVFTIDTRVRCAVPQFSIDQKPLYFPIIAFVTMGGFVDPKTGNLKPHAGAAPTGSADEKSSAKPKKTAQPDKPKKAGDQ